MDPPSGVEIDRPGLSDMDELVSLWQALVRNQHAYGTWIRAEGNEASARSWLSAQMTFDGIRVAVVEDELVGFVTFELMVDQFDRRGQDGIVHNLFVRAAHRNSGIGSTLLDRAETVLADRGADRIRLEILAANDEAVGFYRDRGYTPHRQMFKKVLEE